jgi:hypothetical protein
MPADLRDHMEELIKEYKAIRAKDAHLKKRMDARTAPLRIAMGELYDKYGERLGRLEKRRKELTAQFLDLWSKRLPGLRSVVLPSAVVRKRRDIKVTVLDKQEVIDALDRLDRLDLVDEVVDEKGLRDLARQGKLDGLPAGAVEIKVDLKIQAYGRKED